MCTPVIPARKPADTCRKVGSRRPISRWRHRCGSEAALIGRIPYRAPHRLSVNTVTIHDLPFGDHLCICSGFVLLSGSIFCRLSHSPFCLPLGLLSLSVNYISLQLSTPFDFNISFDFISRNDTLLLFPFSLTSSNKAPPFHRAPSPHLPWRSTEEENPNHAHAHAVLPAIHLPLSFPLTTHDGTTLDSFLGGFLLNSICYSYLIFHLTPILVYLIFLNHRFYNCDACASDGCPGGFLLLD